MQGSLTIGLGSILLALGCTLGADQTVTLYVAPEGNDTWSGRLANPNPQRTDGPLATLERAQQAVRQLRRQGALPGPVQVMIRGVQRLARPLVFTPQDSGTEKCPVTWSAMPGQKAVLSGGRPITGWRQTAPGVWSAEVPEVKAGRLYFRQLFVDGRRATRARNPNAGYFHVEGLVSGKSGGEWNAGVDRFRFRGEDLRPYSDLNNVEVVVIHSWNTSRVRIASVDTSSRVVTFTGPTVFRPLAWDPQQRYYVENAAELLDAPGEWYLDRTTGRVSYRPLPGENPAQAEFIAPVITELVRIDGDADGGKLVEHLHLAGLVLEHADWTLDRRGYGDSQAAVTVPAAVSAKGARRCSVENCEIRHVGIYGLWFSRGCKDNRILRNHIHDLGAGAVRLGEPVMPNSDQTTSTGNLISNNYLHDGGCVYDGAVGLWLAQASDNEVSHNEIHSFNYSGISTGWNWSDAPTRTLRNRIEYNHVHHVVRGVLSDAGGIYTLGTQTGTVVRNNVFHDIFPYRGEPTMAWGLYFDQDSNGLTAENNVVYNTLTGGIMNTGSQGNVIRNNVFAFSGWQAAWRWTNLKNPVTVVERNIFYVTQGDLFHNDGGREDRRSRWDRNLYWRTDGRPLEFYEEPFAQWQAKGHDRNGLVADPKFVDPARYDFRLQPDSPALKLGIRSIDTSTVGLIGDPQWVALPKQAKFPPTVLDPPLPPAEPVPLDDGFEGTPAGQAPRLAVLQEESRGDSIRVVDDSRAASGRRSLCFHDVAGLKYAFNPHLFYVPHFRNGLARLRFDLRLEKGAIVGHEWRDDSSPARVGPSILVNADGKLTAGGKTLARVPIGEWFGIEIACGLGASAAGGYELALRLPGQPAKTFKLACGSSRFSRLEWLGFTSLATDKTEFRLDNLKLELAGQAPAGTALPGK
jgi:hypothetical protein